MNKCFVAFLALFVSFIVVKADAVSSTAELLDSLDYYVANEAAYSQAAGNRLAAKVHELPKLSPDRRQVAIEQVVEDYLHFNIDSAFHYLSVGEELALSRNDSLALQRLHLMKLRAYPLKGLLYVSLTELENTDLSSLSPQIRNFYYSCATQIYRMAADMIDLPEARLELQMRAAEMTDSLSHCYPAGSLASRYCSGLSRLNEVDGVEAVAELTELLDSHKLGDMVDARLAADIGNYYYNVAHNNERARYYYAISAINDIKTGNGETTSLHRLGRLLYEEGDIDRAYLYLTSSLARSVSAGARLRALEIAEALPLVLATTADNDAAHRRRLLYVVIALVVFAGALAVLSWRLYQQRRHLAEMKKHLEDRHQIKDEYIRQVLSLCSVYITSLTDLNKLAARKLRAKQYADLLEMLESGRIMRQQLQIFYEVFDAAFLRIYPFFIEGVNNLLQPGRGVALPAANTLTPELRMLAFIRLGIDDSSEIANFLGLSVNSIYTYRNKMKARAIDRDNFEKKLLEIDDLD